MYQRKTGIFFFLLFLSMTGLIGCGFKKENKEEVNIGYFNNITHAQALYMKSEKSLENSLNDDVNVKWTGFNAGPAQVEALFSGDIDIGYIGPVPAINANIKSQGEISILCSAAKGGAVLIKREDSDIQTVDDLDGKTVAIPQLGNTQHLCLLQLLKEHGLSPVSDGGTVFVTAVSNADIANTMERGDVDAALLPEPWGTMLLKQGAGLVLDYDEIYENGEYDVAVVVVRNEFAQEHPDIVETFLKEHEKATNAILNDSENAFSIINTQLQNTTGKALEDDVIRDAFEKIVVSTSLNKEAVLSMAEISREQGFIKELPTEDIFYSIESTAAD